MSIIAVALGSLSVLMLVASVAMHEQTFASIFMAMSSGFLLALGVADFIERKIEEELEEFK